MDKIKALLHGIDFIPFVMATGSQVHLSIARIIEALIIAAVTGGVVLYGANQVLGTKLEEFTKTYNRDRSETVQWRYYVQEEINKNKDRISSLKEGK